MKNYLELIEDYNFELNEANEIIMTSHFNKEELAYDLLEKINETSKVTVSVCTYPDDNDKTFTADFFFSTDNLTNEEIAYVCNILECFR